MKNLRKKFYPDTMRRPSALIGWSSEVFREESDKEYVSAILTSGHLNTTYSGTNSSRACRTGDAENSRKYSRHDLKECNLGPQSETVSN